jgi:hypothetical protein
MDNNFLHCGWWFDILSKSQFLVSKNISLNFNTLKFDNKDIGNWLLLYNKIISHNLSEHYFIDNGIFIHEFPIFKKYGFISNLYSLKKFDYIFYTQNIDGQLINDDYSNLIYLDGFNGNKLKYIFKNFTLYFNSNKPCDPFKAFYLLFDKSSWIYLNYITGISGDINSIHSNNLEYLFIKMLNIGKLEEIPHNLDITSNNYDEEIRALFFYILLKYNQFDKTDQTIYGTRFSSYLKQAIFTNLPDSFVMYEIDTIYEMNEWCRNCIDYFEDIYKNCGDNFIPIFLPVTDLQTTLKCPYSFCYSSPISIGNSECKVKIKANFNFSLKEGALITTINANVNHTIIIKTIEAIKMSNIFIHTNGIKTYRVNKKLYQNGSEEFMLEFSEPFVSDIEDVKQLANNDHLILPTKFEHLLSHTLFSTTWRKYKIYLPIVYKLNTLNFKLSTKGFMKIFKFHLEGTFPDSILQRNNARILPAKKEYHSIFINNNRNYTPSDLMFISNVIFYGRLFNCKIETLSLQEKDLIGEILQINKITFSETGRNMVPYLYDVNKLDNIRFNTISLDLLNNRTNINIIYEIFKPTPRNDFVINAFKGNFGFEDLLIDNINKLYHLERKVLIQLIEIYIIKLQIVAPSMVVTASGVNQVTRCGYETKISIILHDMREKIETVTLGNLSIHLSGLQTNSPQTNKDNNQLWTLNFSSWRPHYIYDLIHLNEKLYHPIPNVSYAHWMYVNRDYGNMFIPITLNLVGFFKKRKYKIYFSSVYENPDAKHLTDCIWRRQTDTTLVSNVYEKLMANTHFLKNENLDNLTSNLIFGTYFPKISENEYIDYLKIVHDEYEPTRTNQESLLTFFSHIRQISETMPNVLTPVTQEIKTADVKTKFIDDKFLIPTPNFEFVVCNNLTSHVAKSSDFVDSYEFDFKEYSNPLLIIIKCGMFKKDPQVINNSFTLILHLISTSDDSDSESDESFITFQYRCNSEYILEDLNANYIKN